MDEMDEKKKSAFLAEYTALCRRFGLFVSRGPHSDDHFYVRSIDCGLPATPRLWYNEQLDELERHTSDSATCADISVREY